MSVIAHSTFPGAREESYIVEQCHARLFGSIVLFILFVHTFAVSVHSRKLLLSAHRYSTTDHEAQSTDITETESSTGSSFHLT